MSRRQEERTGFGDRAAEPLVRAPGGGRNQGDGLPAPGAALCLVWSALPGRRQRSQRPALY